MKTSERPPRPPQIALCAWWASATLVLALPIVAVLTMLSLLSPPALFHLSYALLFPCLAGLIAAVLWDLRFRSVYPREAKRLTWLCALSLPFICWSLSVPLITA